MISKGNKVLITMLVAAAIALAFGFYVMHQRIQPPKVSDQQNQTDNTTPTPPPTTPTPEPETTSLVSTTGWKVYENDKHKFSIMYPPTHKAGEVSENSVLGTFQAPVRGFHVGPLVLVILKDATLKKEAQDYFDGVYKAATNPAPSAGEEVAPIECKINSITNSKVVSTKAVTCNGEGGLARYAYIQGKSYDVFVDGYSKGYDNSNNGDFTGDADFVTVLSTFTFTTEASATTNPDDTTQTADTVVPPSIQSFTVTADDISATPTEISATKGAIVQVTFNVGANVASGGLDFKSSVANSGVISAGTSKTISFKAASSFAFTPYLPSSQVAKDYTIKVTVQ
jgi:hypothetical protein